jgi:hypothetical protein
MFINRELFMKTGKRALQLGLYASACCNEELLFDVDDRFIRCLTCASDTHWRLLEPVISWQELMEETSPEMWLAA